MRQKNIAQLNLNLAPETKQAFSELCENEKTTMSAVLKRYINFCLATNKIINLAPETASFSAPLEDYLEEKVEDEIERLVDEKVEEKVAKIYAQLACNDNLLQAQINELKEMLEAIAHNDLEALVEDVVEEKVEKKVEEKVEKKVEEKVEDTVEEKIEDVEEKVEEQVEDTVEEKIKDVDEKVEDIVEDIVEEKIEDVEKKVEEQLSFFAQNTPTDTPSKPKNCTQKGLAIVQSIISAKLDSNTTEADIIEYLEHKNLGKPKYLKRDLNKNIRACSVQLVGCQCNDFAELKQVLLLANK